MRKGQYFTIDAFAALMVIATGLILVFATGGFRQGHDQPQLLSQEYINILAQIKVKDLNSVFLSKQIKAGNITNTDNTILQQAYEFKEYYALNLSTWLISNVTLNIIPNQFNFEIVIDDDVIHSRGSGQNTSGTLISNKRIVFGVVNKSAEFWGPVIAEVKVWK